MSKRALILVLSVVGIAIALAGLQGILNIMAKRGPLDNMGSRQPITVTGSPTPTKSNITPTPKIDQTKSAEFPFDISILNNLASAYPALDISLEGELPAHLPLFKLTGGLGTPYLRSTVASIYQNRKWNYDTSLPVTKYTGEKLTYPIGEYARKSLTNIEIKPASNIAASKMPIPVSQYVNKLTAGFPVSHVADDSIFISDSGIPAAYSFDVIKYVFDEETLIKAKIDSGAQYLEVPDEITNRTTDLAMALTKDIKNPYQKAKAIEQYLKDNYVYDFEYQRAPDDWDPNEWFLFEEQKGVCTNFNSAFVILARAAGIPARLVGGYYVDPQSESQVIYADQAHAWSEIKLEQLGWITFDATGSNQSALIATTTEITEVDKTVEKNTPFTVKGTVTSSDTPVEGVLVELYINQNKTIQNGTLVGQAIVSNGTFQIEAKLTNLTQVGNYQLIAHSSQTPRFEESTSDPIIKVMSETLLSLSSVPKVKVGQPIYINGQLLETSKQMLSGQVIDIKINGNLLTKVTTDIKGKFEYQSTFDKPGKYDIGAEYGGSEFYHASDRSISFQVLSPTTLTMQSLPKLKAGQTLKIEGFLKTNTDMKPVADQTIELFVNTGATGIKAKTDTSGHYVLEHKMKKPGIFQVDAKYLSQPFYWDSNASAAIEVLATNNKTILGLLLMLAGAVIATGYGGFRYYRKHKPLFRKRKAKLSVASLPQPELTQAPAEPPEITHNDGFNLNIEFPSIVNPLPDVWGIGDDFEVACQLSDIDGKPMSEKELEIAMGSPITTLTTDVSGKGDVTLAFSEKGSFEIEAVYSSENTDGTDTRALKTIRIVDYREEIIDEYRNLLEWFKQKEVPISQDNSPREIERLVLNSGLAVSPDSLETAIACFEEATYSLHPVTRQHYVKMHFAQEDIRENESQPEQSPE